MLPESLKVGELKMRIVVASQGLKGLEDVVSQVFGRSPTFTFIDVEDGRVKKCKAEKNSLAGAPHGAGPLTCARLSKLGVEVVVAANFGPTVSAILKEAEIEMITVKPGIKVEDAIQQYLKTFKASTSLPTLEADK
ncbi:MAG: NifB/NifX family molybdenum-iron cluster-binding protein [Candidatus Bathyarchaeia archaeon]